MLSLPEDWDYSLMGLCAICKESRDAIRSTLKELQKYGYLQIEKVRGDKGYFEIPAYWKGNKAYLHKDGIVTEIEVAMESDFEGEITHAVECIEEGLTESPILGEEMSVEIIRVAESVQKSL